MYAPICRRLKLVSYKSDVCCSSMLINPTGVCITQVLCISVDAVLIGQGSSGVLLSLDWFSSWPMLSLCYKSWNVLLFQPVELLRASWNCQPTTSTWICLMKTKVSLKGHRPVHDTKVSKLSARPTTASWAKGQRTAYKTKVSLCVQPGVSMFRHRNVAYQS